MTTMTRTDPTADPIGHEAVRERYRTGLWTGAGLREVGVTAVRIIDGAGDRRARGAVAP